MSPAQLGRAWQRRKGQRTETQRPQLNVTLTERFANEKGLLKKGGEALQSPAAGYWGLGVRNGACGHLPGRDAPSCGHRAAGPRRCSGSDGVCGPSPREAGEIPLQVVQPLRTKLEKGSAFVSKVQSRERLGHDHNFHDFCQIQYYQTLQQYLL